MAIETQIGQRRTKTIRLCRAHSAMVFKHAPQTAALSGCCQVKTPCEEHEITAHANLIYHASRISSNSRLREPYNDPGAVPVSAIVLARLALQDYAFTTKSRIIERDHRDSVSLRIEALRLPIDRAAIIRDIREQTEVIMRSELYQWAVPGRGRDRRPVEPREQLT